MSESTLFKIALNKAMSVCSRREFCTSDVRSKLQSWGIGNDEEEKIINILTKENFINESRFAMAFVKDRFNYNKWGKTKISLQLKIKKIPSEIIKVALDSIDHDAYLKLLNDLISVHRRTVKAKNRNELKAKLLRYGLSKGFESCLLYDILNDTEE